MNIFVLDKDPIKAALYHCDSHVVKMILEYSQILYTAHVLLDGERMAQRRLGAPMLKPTSKHLNACVVWARTCGANYSWLYSLLGGVVAQYRARYGRQHRYAATGLYSALGLLPAGMPGPLTLPLTPHPLLMPEAYKTADAVFSYRLYYIGEKNHFAKWRAPAVKPDWYVGAEERRIAP